MDKANQARGENGKRRLNGVYYTPKELAIVLVEWAIGNGEGNILDPSCGTGVFLEAAMETVGKQRTSGEHRKVIGVDIDPAVASETESRLGDSICSIVVNDFLITAPTDLDGFPFQAVVGNPPYVRHHWVNGVARDGAALAAKEFSHKLPGRSSLWAYFVLHAMRFLNNEGSLAMVVPESLLQTNYGQVVQEALVGRFAETYAIRIHERVFAGTDEVAVILAATGEGPGTFLVKDVSTASEIAEILNGPKTRTLDSEDSCGFRRVYHPECFDLLHKFIAESSFAVLEEMAEIRIGIVTGANDYFVFTPNEVKSSEIPNSCFVPVITRSAWLKGIDFTVKDRLKLTELDGRSMLCVPTQASFGNQGVVAWIKRGEMAKCHERYKCQQRNPWYLVQTKGQSDAFVTCCRAGYPRLSLNSGGVKATNVLHFINWKEGVIPRDVAIGFLTTVTAAYSEIYGRWYGGGVLKIEPGLLKNIPVPTTTRVSRKQIVEIDALLRSGKEEDARILADSIVLENGYGFSSHELRRLRTALAELSAKRKRFRRRDGNVG